MALFNRTTDVASGTQVLDDITGDYVIDPAHSRIAFSARHAMVTKVRGQFDEFEGTAHVDAADPSRSTVKVTIKAASITTGQPQRDAHLTTPDFFDVQTSPEITFVSSQVERDGTQWVITGDLTINDVTKPITIPFEETGSARDPFGNLRVGFEGTATVDRSDWGLKWNSPLDTGGVLVSEKVTLEFDVSAIRQAG